MFRVVENNDGSTTVYFKETGDFVCVVAQKNDNIHKQLCFNRPLLRRALEDSSNHSGISPLRVCAQNNAATAPGIVLERKKLQNNIFPIAEEPADDSPDYSDDCITQEEFLQTLNLVSKNKWIKKTPKQLKSEFPYRNISKTESKPFVVPPEAKLYEGVPICSELTAKWYSQPAVSAKFGIKDNQVISASFIRQAQYCKTAEQCDNGINFPRLRCREQKLYPLTYRINKAWGYLNHMYSFNKRERLERWDVLLTGLNKRGNYLRSLCVPLSVKVRRLSKREIAKWTKRRKIPNQMIDVQPFYLRRTLGKPFRTSLRSHPGLLRVFKSPVEYVKLVTKFDSLFHHAIAGHPKKATQDRRRNALVSSSKKKNPYKCKVLLRDALWDLCQYDGACYVEDGSIKVNDVHILPVALWQFPTPLYNIVALGSGNNHAFYCVPDSTCYHLIQTHIPYAALYTEPNTKPTCSYIEFKRSVPLPQPTRDQTLFDASSIRTSNEPKHPFVCIDLTNGSKNRLSKVSFSDTRKVNGGCTDHGVSSVNENANHVTVEQNSKTVSESCGKSRGVKRNSTTEVNGSSSRPKRAATINLDSNVTQRDVHKSKKSSKDAISGSKSRNSGNASSVICRKIKNFIQAELSSTSSLDDFTLQNFTHIFHCYGCSFHSEYPSRDTVVIAIEKHMVDYHSVAQPESFLKFQPKKLAHQSVLIEAFPGFDA